MKETLIIKAQLAQSLSDLSLFNKLSVISYLGPVVQNNTGQPHQPTSTPTAL